MTKAKDPLEGITLETILTELVANYGWKHLAKEVPVRCFMFDSSFKSSLKFLRQTPWARTKVENIYRAWKLEPPKGKIVTSRVEGAGV